MKKKILSLIIITIAMVSGCKCAKDSQGRPLDNPAGKNIEISPAKLSPSNTKFALKLYKEMLAGQTDRNVFVSPFSISSALAMAYNGADGETREAMARVLALEGFKIAEINAAYADLRAKLGDPDRRIELNIANSLWASKDIKFNHDFIKVNKSFYGADIEGVDFGNQKTPAVINNWVSKRTNGKIKEIVSFLSPLTRMVLANAVYFKGDWFRNFDPRYTEEKPFYPINGKEKMVPMMRQEGNFKYLAKDNFQAIKLYYKDLSTSMYIFLPDRDFSLKEFHQKLSPEKWKDWPPRFTVTNVDLEMPRFKIEYEAELAPTLVSLGMGRAFDATKANFKRMTTDTQVFIDQIKHKTFVEVNEKGTEAAAATASMFKLAAKMSGPRKVYMIVNRPFFVAIVDDKTDSILFMGSIVDPE